MAKKIAKKKGRFSGKIKNAIERKAARRSNFGYLKLPKGISLFKEEEGKVKLDIIPYIVSSNNHPDKESGAEKGEQWFCLPFKIHRNIGSDNDKVVCPTTFGKKCPICEYRAKLLRSGNAKKEETDALRPSNRVLYNVIPIDHKKLDAVPHLWDVSEYAFQDLLDNEINENEQYEDFADIEIGNTLQIRFAEEKVGKNAFCKANRIDFLERDEQYDESILKKVADLDKTLIVLSYEELEQKFLEMESSDSVDDDDDDIIDEDDDDIVSRKKKSSSNKKKAVKDDEDDEYEDEDEDDEYDDEDEDDDDEYEDEEDDEEDDEDEEEDDEEDEDEDDDDEEDDDEDEDDDEPAPLKRSLKKPSQGKTPVKRRR